MKNKRIVILIILLIAIASGVFFIIYKNKNKISDDENINDNMKLIIGEDTVTDYYVNEDFVYPKVYVIYSDERVVDITNSDKKTIEGFDLSKSGVQTVKIKYVEDNLIAQFDYKIYIYPATLTSIAATYAETDIIWGENIDKTKLTVTAYYSNTTNKQISDYTLKYNSEPDDYGQNEVSVTYKECTTTFSINVIERQVDAEYSTVENEIKSLLVKLGVINPTCPKDYEFVKDAHGDGRLKANGVLDGYSEEQMNELYSFISTNLFDGYTFVSGPEDTNEAIFPSKKIVFINETLQIDATIYITKFGNQLQYLLDLSKTITPEQ